MPGPIGLLCARMAALSGADPLIVAGSLSPVAWPPTSAGRWRTSSPARPASTTSACRSASGPTSPWSKVSRGATVASIAARWGFLHAGRFAVAYREAFPEVVLLAERNTAGWLELNQVYWSKMSTAPDSPPNAGSSQ